MREKKGANIIDYNSDLVVIYACTKKCCGNTHNSN